jgi:hypothetical protein
MRSIIAALALSLVGLAATSGAAHAEITYPWCAQYSGSNLGGGRNCGFWTFEQCMATVSGIGGFCEVNTMYRPSPGQIPPPPGLRRPRG